MSLMVTCMARQYLFERYNTWNVKDIAGQAASRWQAARWPGAISRITGGISRQTGRACGQRVWKRQPDGGAIALGTSPSTATGARGRVGSGSGTEAISAWV